MTSLPTPLRTSNARGTSKPRLAAAVAAAVATLSLTGCSLIAPDEDNAPLSSAPSSAPSDSAVEPGAPQEGAADAGGQLLGDGLLAPVGTRLGAPVGSVENAAAGGWYATLIVTRTSTVDVVVADLVKQLKALGFKVASGGQSVHAFRGQKKPSAAEPTASSESGGTLAAPEPAAPPGTYVDVTGTTGSDDVPPHVQISSVTS